MAITKVTNRVLEDSSVGVAQLSAGAVTEAKIADNAVSLNKLITTIQQALLPVGAVQAFARVTAPPGWLICSGDTVSTSGTVQGIPGSALTGIFNLLVAEGYPFGASGGLPQLPDLRGVFIRGHGTNAKFGPSSTGNLGRYQDDAFQGHHHRIQFAAGSRGTSSPSGAVDIKTTDPSGDSTRDNRVIGAISDGTSGTPRTASETRPVNISLLYCIKY